MVDLVVLDPYSSDGWVSKQVLEATVGTTDSGGESRVQRWAEWRREYEIPFENMRHDQRVGLRDFHRLRRGVVRGFLLWDVFECYAPNQPIGVGTGSRTTFQLRTTIADAVTSLVRTIRYPVPTETALPYNVRGWVPGATTATTSVKVGGNLMTEGVHYTVSRTTGALTFLPGAVPPSGAAIVATFWHYTPVRFLDKELSVAMKSISGNATPALIELLNE